MEIESKAVLRSYPPPKFGCIKCGFPNAGYSPMPICEIDFNDIAQKIESYEKKEKRKPQRIKILIQCSVSMIFGITTIFKVD